METAAKRYHVARIKEDTEAARAAVTEHRYDEAQAHALTAIAGALSLAAEDIVDELADEDDEVDG